MNNILLRRLFWKEFRTQRGLWLGVMAISLVVQLLVWAMMPPNQRQPQATLMSIGLILSAFYAVGCAAVMFAGEREDRTDTWLRNLPVGSLTVFFSKLAWMLSSWIVSAALSLLVAVVLADGSRETLKIDSQILPNLVSYGALLPLWGILFSLVCRRVHLALGLAAVMLLLTMGLNSYFPGAALVVVLCLTAANLGFARDWLLVGEERRQAALVSPRAFTLDKALAKSVEASPAWRFFRRELWLEWRHARWWALGYFVAAAAILGFGLFARFPDWQQTTWFVVFAVTPLCFGASVFRSEQYRERYRFQANHGASPAALWFSKQLVWVGLLVATQLLLTTFLLPTIELSYRATHVGSRLYQLLPLPDDFLPFALRDRMLESSAPFLLITAGTTCLLYGIGFVCSLFFAQSITSLVIAIIAGAGALFWMVVAVLLDVPLILSAGLPCLLFIGFSIARTSGWLAERSTIRDHLKLGAVAALLGLCVLSSWVVFRVSEFDLPRPVAAAFALFPPVGLAGGFTLIGAFLAPVAMLAGLVIVVGLFRWRKTIFGDRLKIRARHALVGYGVLHILTGLAVAAFWGQPDLDQIATQLPQDIADFTPTDEALETGEMYKRADEILTERFPLEPREPDEKDPSQFKDANLDRWENLSAQQRQWLADNTAAFDMLWEATQRERCALQDQFHNRELSNLPHVQLHWARGMMLLRLKSLQAESMDNLESAWNFHRAAIRMVAHYSQGEWATGRYWLTYPTIEKLLEHDIVRWLSHPGQTPELLDTAAEQLVTEFRRIMPLAEAYHLEATHALNDIRSNNLHNWISGSVSSVGDLRGGLYMLLHAAPWERRRAQRVVWQNDKLLGDAAQQVATGDVRYFAQILAALALEQNNYWMRRYPVVAVYANRRSAFHDRAKHLEWTTPFNAESIRSTLGTYPYHTLAAASSPLFLELDWIRARRLLFLRIWSKTRKLSDNPKVADQILRAGESLETGSHFTRSDDTPERYSPLMQNPMTGSAFESDEFRILPTSATRD